MKLADVLALAKPFLAADKTPEQLEAAILAADKKAKDGLEGNVASSKEIEDRRAKDRKARDEKYSEDRAARDAKRAADRKARDEKRAADRKARDEKFGKDRNDDPEGTNDAEMKAEKEAEDAAECEGEDEGDPSTPGGNRAGGKTAIDSAEVDTRIRAAVEANNALHEARAAVEPILGKVTFDSAEAVYRAALDKLSVDHKGVPAAGLPAMLKVAKDSADARAAAAAAGPIVALDSTSVAAVEKIIPGYGRLK
jgi:colicin import membrane protein